MCGRGRHPRAGRCGGHGQGRPGRSRLPPGGRRAGDAHRRLRPGPLRRMGGHHVRPRSGVGALLPDVDRRRVRPLRRTRHDPYDPGPRGALDRHGPPGRTNQGSARACCVHSREPRFRCCGALGAGLLLRRSRDLAERRRRTRLVAPRPSPHRRPLHLGRPGPARARTAVPSAARHDGLPARPGRRRQRTHRHRHGDEAHRLPHRDASRAGVPREPDGRHVPAVALGIQPAQRRKRVGRRGRRRGRCDR